MRQRSYKYEIDMPVHTYFSKDLNFACDIEKLQQIDGEPYKRIINKAMVEYMVECDEGNLPRSVLIHTGRMVEDVVPWVKTHYGNFRGMITIWDSRRFKYSEMTKFEYWAEERLDSAWVDRFKNIPIEVKGGYIFVKFITKNVSII
ncbi:MAG: hypothetical protein IKI97_03205 [Clostridia bacterium]|nr:hypothetical protein [Clostridia bacterium]